MLGQCQHNSCSSNLFRSRFPERSCHGECRICPPFRGRSFGEFDQRLVGQFTVSLACRSSTGPRTIGSTAQNIVRRRPGQISGFGPKWLAAAMKANPSGSASTSSSLPTRDHPGERLITLKFRLDLVGDLHAADDCDAGGNRKRVVADRFRPASPHHSGTPNGRPTWCSARSG